MVFGSESEGSPGIEFEWGKKGDLTHLRGSESRNAVHWRTPLTQGQHLIVVDRDSERALLSGQVRFAICMPGCVYIDYIVRNCKRLRLTIT